MQMRVIDEGPLETSPPTLPTAAGDALYSLSDEAIAVLRTSYTGLTATDRDGYEAVRRGIGELRHLRGRVEKRRVELKADALTWGRHVDAEAKRLTAALLEIEEPLRLAKETVDEAKERARQAKEDEERARVEAEIRAKREAEEAAARALREAEEAELRAERQRLIEERKNVEEQRQAEAAKHAKERAALDGERRLIEDTRRRLEQDERERQTKAKAERDQAEIEKRKQEIEAQLQAALPDAEKIQAFAAVLRRLGAVEMPNVRSIPANKFVCELCGKIEALAVTCDGFDAVEWLDDGPEQRKAGHD